MKKNSNYKKTSLIIICTLLIILSIGYTLAYLSDKTMRIDNTFLPTEVTCEVIEPEWENGKLIKENVSIKNTGDVDAFIRVAIVANWKDSNGNIAPVTPEIGVDYELVFKADTNWDVETTDGYYYYTTAISTQAETDVLVEECEVLTPGPDGYALSLEIVASAIQADGINSETNNPPVVDFWNVTYNSTTKMISK